MNSSLISGGIIIHRTIVVGIDVLPAGDFDQVEFVIVDKVFGNREKTRLVKPIIT